MYLSKNINENKIRVAYQLQRGEGKKSLTYVKMHNFCSFEILIVCYLILKES